MALRDLADDGSRAFPILSTVGHFVSGFSRRNADFWSMLEARGVPDNEPTMVFEVLTPIIGPVSAKPGQILAWWMAHPAYTLWVLDPTGTTILQRAWCEPGRAPSLLMAWDSEGCINCLTASFSAWRRSA